MAATTKITQDPYKEVLIQILAEVTKLRQEIELNENQRLQSYQQNYFCGCFSKSAFNLAHYLAMRQFDLRHLQDRLAQAGLSSLGRAESLSTFDSLIDILFRATDSHYQPGEKSPNEYGFNRGHQLRLSYLVLFGQCKAHVMVTLGEEASWNYELVSSLLLSIAYPA